MRNIFLSATVLFFLLSAMPARAEHEPNPNIGKHLYRAYCMVCHGPEGNTRGPLAKKRKLIPADLTTNRYQVMNVDKLADIIGFYGRKEGSQMPRWGDAIPETNLRHLASYVKRLTKKGLQFRGDVRRGRVIYQSACAACHGKRGKGNGILADLIGIAMVDFTEKGIMKKISDDDLLKIIRKGKGDFMPAWHGALNDSEIFNVAAFVRQLGR